MPHAADGGAAWVGSLTRLTYLWLSPTMDSIPDTSLHPSQTALLPDLHPYHHEIGR
jgi:hypothetical protein